MINTFKNLVADMTHTLKREDVSMQFNKSALAITNDVVPGLDELIDYLKSSNMSIKDLPELGAFNTQSGIKAKDVKGLIVDIKKVILGMDKNVSDLSGLIETDLPEIISRDVITVKQAGILNVLNNYNSVSLYTLDLAMYIINVMDVKKHSSAPMLKSKVSEIRSELMTYASMMKYFEEHNKKIVSNLKDLSSDVIKIDSNDPSLLSRLMGNKNKMPFHGFIGNPVYHVRMWFVDREIAKYEVLKEKKKLIELKILDLKARESGEENPKLQKQIEYYEEKLATVEYKIRNIEE